jgi:HlyD family secretion protein
MHQIATSPSLSKKKKKPIWRRWYSILGIVLLLWITVSTILGKREKPIPVTTEKAIRKTILETVSATGKVQPEVEVKISPEVAGEIIDLPVEDGVSVKKGDLLVKIRPDSYKALVEQQEAAISTAKSVNVQQRASLDKAEQDLRRAQDLFSKRMISESEFVTAQTARDVAQSTYESSKHGIESAEAASSQARDQLLKTTIYSPMDGSVTLLNSKLGERVVATNQFAGTEVMRVADLSHMEARVDVNENDVVKVKVGDKANVKIDAYRDRKFQGTVQQIANTGKTTGAGTQEEVTNFEVKIRINAPGVTLRPGLSCTSEIETDLVKDVVAVPMQSVTIRAGEGNLSPEEIEKRKEKVAARDKGDSDVEVTSERQEKRAQKEEREALNKVVFLNKGDNRLGR